MAMIGKIRRMYFREKKSVREISRLTSLSRNTIDKWLKAPGDAEPKYRREARDCKLTPFHDELRRALKADAQRPRRDRRTAKALFAQIQQAGYTGGYSGVTDFIRAWRTGAGAAAAVNAFVPLSFADLPEPLQRLRRAILREDGGDRVMAQVLALVPELGLEAVLVAVELALESLAPSGRISAQHVINVLGRLHAACSPTPR